MLKSKKKVLNARTATTTTSTTSTATTTSTDLTGQSYIFDTFYRNINELIKSYEDGTYLQKFKQYFDASKGNFSYYFQIIALSYYNILFHGSTLTLDSACVKNMADKFEAFRREIVDEPKAQWYKMSHSILGSMSSIGFTNIYTTKNWRNKLESAGAGFNSTEKQCELTIGSMKNDSGISVCAFCGVNFIHETGGCLISCEHLLEIGLLTFLTGLTPNMKYLDEDIRKQIIDYFNYLGCYVWACQRCNMLKSNVQSKKYKNNECSIFIKFDDENGFQPNDLALEEFCRRVLDLNRGSYYIVKCSQIKAHILSIHNPHNPTLNYFDVLLKHMKYDVVGRLVDQLNKILEDYYGETKSMQLSSMFSAGIARYAILDLKLLPDLKGLIGGTQYGGNNDLQRSEINETLEQLTEKPTTYSDTGTIIVNPEKVLLINKEQLMNFLKFLFLTKALDDKSIIEKSNLLLFYIEHFIYSINIFFDNMYETFETLYGLKDDIINLRYAKDEIPDLNIESIYNIDIKNIQDFTIQIISFLCTLNNFEIVLESLFIFFTSNLDNFTGYFRLYLEYHGMNYDQIIQNLRDDYLQSMGNIVKTSYIIQQNGYLLTAYGLNDYCYLIHEEFIILCKILEYDGNEIELSENEKMFGTFNVKVVVIYSINLQYQEQVPPNTELILLINDSGKASPDIKVTLEKFCKDNIIILDPSNLSFSGGKYKKNQKKSKKNQKKSKNNKIKSRKNQKILNKFKSIKP